MNHNLPKGWLIFDPLDYDINWVPIRNDELHPQKRAEAMKELYPDAEDLPPPKMPLPRGKPVNINVFVDSDHAGNTVTRRSHTGIMIFINMAPIQWYSKKHCSIAYHKVREAVAAEKILIYYENTDSNIADLFTKVLTANKRWPLIQGILS